MPNCETSIIVPIYNVEKYLMECLRSLSAQTAKSYEVILVDDGSTDGSAAIALRFVELFPCFRYVRSENSGPGSARNLGLSLANGEYIGFVDSDDRVTEDFVASLVEPLSRDSAIDMVVCGFRYIAEDGSRVDDDEEGFPYLSSRSVYLRSGYDCYAWNKFFRRALIADYRFDAGRFEDLSLIPYLLCAARELYFVRRPLYFYRQRPQSLSSSAPIDERHLFQVFSAVARLQQIATSSNVYWKDYRSDQLVNHVFVYRIPELLSLVGRDRSLGMLTRYIKLLDVAVPGWARSTAVKRWFKRPTWRWQICRRLLVLALSNAFLRPLSLVMSIIWHAVNRQRFESQDIAVTEAVPSGRSFVSVYDVVECRSIAVAVDPKVISRRLVASLESQEYEVDEERELRHLIQSDEVVLEIGGGCGLVSTYCALREDVKAVFCVEANPLLIPIIAETHRLNGVHVTVYNEVLGPIDGETDFYLHEDFWESARTPDDRAQKIRVKMTSFQSRLDEIKPTLVIVDVEGGELDLFDAVNLPLSVKRIFIEIHQNLIGRAGVKKVFDLLSAKNFHYDQWHSHKHIVTFTHVDRA